MNVNGSRALLLGCTIAVLVFAPLSGRVGASTTSSPWIAGPGWRATWNVSSTDPYLDGISYRLAITSASRDAGGTWTMSGNVSALGFLQHDWIQVSGGVVLATYDPAANVYSVESTAFSDGFVFLPVALDQVEPFSRLDQALPPMVNESMAEPVHDAASGTWSLLNGTGGDPIVTIVFNQDGVPVNFTRWTNGTVAYRLVLEDVYVPERDLLRFFNVFTMIASGGGIALVMYLVLRRHKLKVKDLDTTVAPVDAPYGEDGDAP